MSQIVDPVKPTHEGKQRMNLLSVVYFLVAIAITTVIAFKDVWPITFFQDLLLDDKNMYPVKAVFVLTLVSVMAVLFPEYYIIKKMLQKKNESEAITQAADSLSTSGSGSTARKEFSFEYSAAVCTVVLDGANIDLKMGFRKRNFPLSRLQHFYLIKKKSYQTLYLTYEDESGKTKKLPMNSNGGDAQMNAFVAELESRFPSKSLNHLSQAEAFKIMKVMNPALLAVIILVGIFAITGIIIFLSVR